MRLTENQIENLSESYWNTENIDFRDGLIGALEALKVPQIQIDQVMKG